MADEMITAWIAAGSALAGAVAGGAVTGWFALASARRQAQSTVDAAVRQADAAWAAGRRQAEAAWEAGRRQADAAWDAGRLQAEAQLSVATRTLDAQALAARRTVRRAAYVTFLAGADLAHQRRRRWLDAAGTTDAAAHRDAYRAALPAVREALNVIRLEGPDAVTVAAEALETTLAESEPPERHALAHREFLSAARTALTGTG
ncbi:hypothetical protein [Streptomyces sp. NPDC048737]|uniref:hypothetical protein n=1 Tax=unclassified Streptomyces TaxID=2593676 RepID=UPI003433EA7B